MPNFASPFIFLLLSTWIPLLVIIGQGSASSNDDERNACDKQTFVQMPCRCCKMDCWYSIAKSATHQLGHVPGNEGEEEALATLRLIRACMITECSLVCAPVGIMRKRRPMPIFEKPKILLEM